MPINDLGYRAAREQRNLDATRWWVIADTGVRLAWKSQWLRRMLVLAWLPAAYLGFSIFLFEQSMAQDSTGLAANQLISELPNGVQLMLDADEDPATQRHKVWGLILLTLFRYPQGVLMVMLVGLLAPSLISRDLRSRAYLLYFSRPIDRFSYVLGKSAIVWVYLAAAITLPAMSLYFLGISLSPDLSIVFDTWDLPLRILAASVFLIVPTTLLALSLSSLTTESRYAAFSWFALWAAGWVAYAALTIMEVHRGNDQVMTENPWTNVSLYHSLGQVQSFLFGLDPDVGNLLGPATLWLVITGVSCGLLLHRVAAPMRV